MLKPGMMLCDRYEILAVVGAGGMSIVYKARDHRLNRNVAIKVLKPEFCNDKNFVTKFKTEAQASAGLTHPNIVNVYDVYDDEGIYFIVLELVDGITLKEYIQQNGRLGMEQAIDFSIQIASGLEAAHENHIIHRDIKPQNIIVAKNGNIKVTDFGIARAASSNTLTSGAVGSVHYISPEQARGGYSDERSDIYSLGVTMYEMVTGRVPFEGDNNVSVALMHIQNDMIPPRQYYPDIYSSFEKVIMKATQKKPERRYLTASALIADLKRVQNNPNIDIVVAPTAITNSPTQEWTKEDVRAIRDGSAYKDPSTDTYDTNAYGNAAYNNAGYNNPYTNNQLNTFNNPPVQNEMGEITGGTAGVSGISMMPVNNQKINSLLNEDPWEDAFEEEEPVPVKKNSIKKVADYEDDDYEEDEGNGEIDPGLRKAVTIAGVVTAVIIAIVLMVVLGKLTGIFKFGKSKSTEDTDTEELVSELPMIDVLGYSEDAAVKMLKNMGFPEDKIKIVQEENDEVQEGYVFDQNFKKDEMVDINEEIVLKVSAGAEAVEIPDVSKYTDQQACTILEEAGFKPVHGYSFSDEVEKDLCIKTEPEAGSMAPKGSEVKVIISNGSEVKKANVPNLNGLTETQARQSLEAANLKLGTITYENSDTTPKDQVIKQNPVANTEVAEDTTVDIVISEGPEEKTVTYTLNVSGSVSISNESYDGYSVTVQILFNGVPIDEQMWSIGPDARTHTFNISRAGYTDKTGSAQVVILYENNNVTNEFGSSVGSNFSEETQ
ncbi:MAG: protein kinase [Lachnospiraceae bacterium]|nr:protein kinase [Lachnospiraceae bacterium]